LYFPFGFGHEKSPGETISTRPTTTAGAVIG
jgi:hypothetical protein